MEHALLAAADQGRVAVRIAEAATGLVVPRSYRGYGGLAKAQSRFAAAGWPVWLRLSGGGLVPQAAGVINIHLACPVQASQPLQAAETHYRLLCGLLARALADIGIDAVPAPVQGSFCDGRFNLAVGGRKIAGTAQYWRRNTHPHAAAPYSLLSQAVLLADADTARLTRMANRFETAIASGRCYVADAITSAARCCGTTGTTARLLVLLSQHAAQLAEQYRSQQPD